MRKTDSLPMNDLESPIIPSDIQPIINKPKTNMEIFTDKTSLTHISDKSLNDEFAALQTLKDHQLNLQSPAISHISGARNSVIYFNQVEVKSNSDVMNVTSPSDINSTKYNRIDNMIIVTEEEIVSNFETDENGMTKNDITGTGKVFPGFTPYIGDLFYISEIKEIGILYQIISVDPISQYEGTGFNISFRRFYSQFSPEQLLSRVENYYVFRFEAVGTNQKPVMEKSLYEVYDAVKETRRLISNEYLNRYFDNYKNIIYYHQKSNIFNDLNNESLINFAKNATLDLSDFKIVDPYVILFYNSCSIFEKYPIDLNDSSIIPEVPLYLTDKFKDTFKFTIYNAIQKRDKTYIKYSYFEPIKYNVKTLIEIPYTNWYYFKAIIEKNENCIDIYPENLINRIQNNLLYTDINLLKYNIIIKYFNIKDYVPNYDELINLQKNIEFSEYSELYGVAPLIMYICAYFEELVSQKTY